MGKIYSILAINPKKSCTFAPTLHALVAELVDALDLGSSVARREGSSPFRRTQKNPNCLILSS